MILFFDLRNDGAAVGAIDASADRWISASGRRIGFRMLARARSMLGGKKPSCVAVAMNASDARRDVSWSTVRAGVAMANALAFAWNVPAAEVRVAGGEPRKALAGLVRKAAKEAKKGRPVGAIYSGEPHITTAKKVI